MKNINIAIIEYQQLYKETTSILINESERLKVIFNTNNFEEFITCYPMMNVKPCILIMEIDANNFNWLKNARKLRRICSQLKVIILTKHKGSEYILPLIKQGAKAYLYKSTPTKDLIKSIITVYEGGVHYNHTVINVVVDRIAKNSKIRNFFCKYDYNVSRLECELLLLLSEDMHNRYIRNLLHLSSNQITNMLDKIVKKVKAKDSDSLIKDLKSLFG